MPGVVLVGAQMLVVLVLRHRYRPGAEGKSMAVKGAQRSRRDACHQRVARIEAAQATGVEVDRAPLDEWAVPTRLPAPFQPEGRAKPVKIEGHHHAASIRVVGQHVAHCNRITVRAVVEGHDDVVRL